MLFGVTWASRGAPMTPNQICLCWNCTKNCPYVPKWTRQNLAEFANHDRLSVISEFCRVFDRAILAHMDSVGCNWGIGQAE